MVETHIAMDKFSYLKFYIVQPEHGYPINN